MSKFTVFILIFLISFSAFAEPEKYVGFDLGQSLSGYLRSQTFTVIGKEVGKDSKCKPYERTYSRAETVTLKTKHRSPFANIYVGYKLGGSAAFEMGAYTTHSFNAAKCKTDGQTRIFGAHMGFVFMLPVVQKLEVLPGLGLTYGSAHVYKPNLIDSNGSGVIPRIMLGLQYQITDHIKIRGSAIWHYMAGIQSDVLTLNNTMNVGIGLVYMLGS